MEQLVYATGGFLAVSLSQESIKTESSRLYLAYLKQQTAGVGFDACFFGELRGFLHRAQIGLVMKTRPVHARHVANKQTTYQAVSESCCGLCGARAGTHVALLVQIKHAYQDSQLARLLASERMLCQNNTAKSTR